jgi:hypothetical protein
LFYDGVAARTKAGAEKKISNIPTSAAHTVEIVKRLTVTGDLALDRDMIVLGILTARSALRIVE